MKTADERSPLVLTIAEEDVDAAVRDLVCIGYDNVIAYAELAALQHFLAVEGTSKTTEEIRFEDLERLRTQDDVIPLDVRFASGYDAGH